MAECMSAWPSTLPSTLGCTQIPGLLLTKWPWIWGRIAASNAGLRLRRWGKATTLQVPVVCCPENGRCRWQCHFAPFRRERGEQPFDGQGGEVPETDGQLQVIRQWGAAATQIAGLDRQSLPTTESVVVGVGQAGLGHNSGEERARSPILESCPGKLDRDLD